MNDQIRLIISNPEHKPTDHEAAARLLGFELATLEGKARYGVPEIWFAGEPGPTDDTAQALVARGFRIAVVSGRKLARVPSPEAVRTFAFGDDAMTLETDQGAVELPYTTPVAIVVGRPHEPATAGLTARRASRSSWSGLPTVDELVRGQSGASMPGAAPENAYQPFVDLYAVNQEGIHRYAAVLGLVRFHGLGAKVKIRAADNLEAYADELELRFTNSRTDRRLVDLVLREPNPPRPDDRRAGYSYATPRLRELLESIDPDLARLPQPDLVSRLVFLTLTRNRTTGTATAAE